MDRREFLAGTLGAPAIGGAGTSRHGDTFLQVGAGAALRTLHDKVSEQLSLRDFGAVGDGVTDDTGAFLDAASAAYSSGKALFVPAGNYRVSRGFTLDGNFQPLRWVGESVTNELGRGEDLRPTSQITFAPATSVEHLLDAPKGVKCGPIDVAFLTIRGVSPRDDGELKLFRLDTGLSRHHFDRVNFEGNHHWSVYYDHHCYFQSASFRDVQFRGCGTIGSSGVGAERSDGLKGTLLVLDNVNHETLMPENARKVVMDLIGVRDITATNLLLEGKLPGDGWTILALNGSAIFERFWSEWIGERQPAYSIAARNCNVTVRQPNEGILLPRLGTKLALDRNARVAIEDANLVGSHADYLKSVEFGDEYSTLIFSRCRLRSIVSHHPQVIFDHCTSVAHNRDTVTRTEVNTADYTLLYEWDGGLPRSNNLVAFPKADSKGHLRTVVIDETYSRLINISRNGDDKAQFRCTVKVPDDIWAGKTLTLRMLARFPEADEEAVNVLRTGGLATSISARTAGGRFAEYHQRIRIPAGTGGKQIFLNESDKSADGDIQIAALRIYLGADTAPILAPVRTPTVQSWDAAAPSSGIWAAGDIVWNIAPMASGTVGWICTEAGSPGVWKAFGSIEP